jgi:rare lipoprotein A
MPENTPINTGNIKNLTAAMPSRKHLGERYRVTYRGKSVVVRINDVGPAAWTHRGIDLSRAAAKRIGLIHAGVGKVCLERL